MSVTGLRGLDEQLVVDTSEGQPVHLLVGPRGSYLRVSASTRQFLRQVGNGVPFEQLAASMSRSTGKPVTPGELETTYHQLVARIAYGERHAGRLRGGFWFRRRLIPGSIVARIAKVCAAAFHPVVAAFAVAAIAAAAALGGRSIAQVAATSFWAQFWPSYGLFLGSLVVHELGHASACARFGVKPSDIGITMYMIYPSFYSDVTAAWELRRHQRVVVDLGGVYFQLLFGLGCAAAYAVTGWQPLCGTLVLIGASCVFSLNPILKFDGYWVVADALGVTNLARQPARIVRHLVGRVRGRPVRALPWSPGVSAVLVVYAAASFGFWAWFLARLVPSAGQQALRCFDLGAGLVQRIAAAPPAPGWAQVREFITSLFLFTFLLIMVGRMLWSIVVWARRAAARRRDPALSASAKELSWQTSTPR